MDMSAVSVHLQVGCDLTAVDEDALLSLQETAAWYMARRCFTDTGSASGSSAVICWSSLFWPGSIGPSPPPRSGLDLLVAACTHTNFSQFVRCDDYLGSSGIYWYAIIQ